MEQILDYVLCEYCKEAMHEAYTKGDGLSYVPDHCNTANVSGMRCRDSRTQTVNKEIIAIPYQLIKWLN